MTINPNMRLIKTGGPAVLPLDVLPRPNTLRLVVKDGKLLPGKARIVMYDTTPSQITSVQEPVDSYTTEPIETL